MVIDKEMFPCPCCGYLTRSSSEHGTFDICPVCNWEDDDVQFWNPNFRGGANQESLNEAKKNYSLFGATSKNHTADVRKPFPNELPKEM